MEEKLYTPGEEAPREERSPIKKRLEMPVVNLILVSHGVFRTKRYYV